MYRVIVTTENGCWRKLAKRSTMAEATALLSTWRVRWYAHYGVITIKKG